MDKQNQALQSLEQLLAKIELDTKRARLMIKQIAEWNYDEIWHSDEKIESLASKLLSYNEDDAVKVIEWVYDGYFMTWSDEKKYPVPMNYASKTKLVPWDVLKLRIMEDGKLIYKLIWPAPRQYIKATLSKTDDNKFTAISDEWNTYMLNQAAVTFFKWKPWDEMSIIVNSENIWEYAAIEAIVNNDI